MALKTKIRLEQVTGSMLQMRPPVFQSRPILQNFNPIDLSGSLGYFSQAIANINGSLDFGAQTPGVILHDSANVPTVLLAGAFDGIQSLKLAQRDGTTDDGMKLVFTSTGAAAASTILLNNNAGTGTDSVKVNASLGGVDIDAKLVLALDGEGGINIGTAADAAIDIDSSTLDIDASGAITIDGTSTVSIDGADDMNFSITSGADGEDLTIAQIGANDSSIFITAAGNGTDAIDIDATAGDMLIAKGLANAKTLKIGPTGAVQMVFSPHGTAASEKFSLINTAGSAADAILIDAVDGGLDIDAGTAIDIKAVTTLSAKGFGGASLGDDVGTWEFDGAGAVTETGMTNFGVTPSGTLTMQGGGVSKYGDDTATWDFDGAGVVTESGMASLSVTPSGAITLTAGAASVWKTSAGSLAIDAEASDLTLDGHSGVNIVGNAAEVDITTTGAVDINSAAGTWDSSAGISLDGATASNFTTAAGALTLDGNGGVLIVGNAAEVDVTTSGAVDINSGAGTWDATTLSLDGTDASNLTVTTGGADAKDLSIGVTGGGNSSLLLTSDGTGGDAIAINSVAGGVDIKGAALVFSGSTATAINFAGDGSMTSGVGGAGMLFAASADYATLRGNTGMNAGTTVLGAINTLAGQVSGATATIFTGSNQSRAVDGDFTVSKLFGDNTNLVPTCGIAKAQVYVNGQLLVSSSIGGVNDYKITANNTIKFKFAMLPDDLVMVIDRS